MKPIGISVLMLPMALIFVSCDAGQLTQNALDVEAPTLSKKAKPDKPPKAELITFVGDLAGEEPVVGCCPNAGPFPEYEMTFSGPLLESFPAVTYDGQIFMNTVGTRTNQSYMVQFWTGEMFLEVRGGEIQEDKKNKSLTATFAGDQMMIIQPISDTECDTTYVDVAFTLTRAPQ